ncbi:MAG TPA: SCO family protein [Burkholderiales bacterium]
MTDTLKLVYGVAKLRNTRDAGAMTRIIRRVLATMLACTALGPILAIAAVDSAANHGRDPRFDEANALKISQAAIGRTLDASYRFTASDGRSITFGDLRGKPLVINLVYTSCYHVCPTITQTVARAGRVAWGALGTDSFRVATIGFDTPADTPERMRNFARERGIDMAQWYFLSTDAATMQALTKDLGFTYFASPKGFDHLAQTTIVDAGGKIYRPVYGDSFAVPTLVEPLKDLVFGRKASTKNWDGWINGIKLFCTVYDPTTGRYKFSYSVFVAIFTGLVSLGALAWFIVRAWRQSGGGPRRPA